MSDRIEILKLGQDLYEAKDAHGYDKQFRVRLLGPEQLNPFRAYLNYQDEWWPLEIMLHTYPIVTKPFVQFTGRVPTCPKHTYSWHPNLFDDGKVCWGTVKVFPEMRVVGLLNMLHGMLHNPNHLSPVPGLARCGMLTDAADQVVGRVKNVFERLQEAQRNHQPGQDWTDYFKK